MIPISISGWLLQLRTNFNLSSRVFEGEQTLGHDMLRSSSRSNIPLPIGRRNWGWVCMGRPDHRPQGDLPDRERFSRLTVFGFSTVQHALFPLLNTFTVRYL